jgi:hypothetical protein
MTTARALFRSILLSSILLFSAVAFVRAEEESGDIQKMMSPDEFKAAGLEKLSPEELQKLNEWLHGFRETTAKAVETKAAKEGRRKFDVIVSRIAGPFYGLTGRTIIKLEDGTVWKQATRSDRIKGSGQDHLGVAVYNAGLFGYKMRIEGTRDFYVDQVRQH